MEELKYIELRREYRERISGFYGVSPIMQGDVSQGGGLNSVLGDTPIIVRKDGKHVDILPIAVLHADYDHTKSKYGLSRYEALSRTGWTPITYSFRQKNSKKIYDITTNDGFTQVTEDHSLFMNGEETRGSEVKVGDKLDIIKPEIKLNDTDSISPELSWALGFYAAEGSSTKLGRNKNNNERQGVRVTVHQTDKKPLEQCKDAFDSFFGVNSKLRLQKNSNGNDIHCLDLSHNHVYDWINKYCYSTYIKRNILDEKTKTTIHREKKVPIQVLNGGKKIQQAFVDGYWMGDGHTDKKGCRRCSGVYKSLMSGLQYLFNQLGETTSISWRSNGKNHIIRMGVLKSGERQKHRLENEVKDIREYDYYGDLYDIETEDHSFVAGVGNILHHNSEGLQFAVTNRAVEHAQMIYNKYVLPFLLDAFGILSWKLELIPSEEEDEMAELQRASQELANARMAVEVGLEVKYKDGKFSITDGILEKPEAGGFPSFGESMEAGGEARQVTGLPDSMQRSLKKEDVPSVKVVKEFTNDDFPIIVEYEE